MNLLLKMAIRIFVWATYAYIRTSDRLIRLGRSAVVRIHHLVDRMQLALGRDLDCMELQQSRDIRTLKAVAFLLEMNESLSQLMVRKGTPYAIGFAQGAMVEAYPAFLRFYLRYPQLKAARITNGSSRILMNLSGAIEDLARDQSSFVEKRISALETLVTQTDRPSLLWFLLIWVSLHPDDLEEKIGDFHEGYQNRTAKSGSRTAQRWLRRQAIDLARRRYGRIAAVLSLVGWFFHLLARRFS